MSAPLSPAMESALTCSARGLVWAPTVTTIQALIARGLATAEWRHTPEGLIERDRIKGVPKLSPIATLAKAWGLEALLTEHTIEVQCGFEHYQIFYHPDGGLWSHGHLAKFGRVSGPVARLFARNTLERLAREAAEDK